MTNPAKDIDDYLASVSEGPRNILGQLREVIKEAAPMAVERISYQVPTFFYNGPLVAFSVSAKRRVWKKHYSFHLMSPSLMSSIKDEIKPYETTTATIHFPVNDTLPVALVKKPVRARMEENKLRASTKKKMTKVS